MAEFDRIADVYDATRNPLPSSVLNAVESMLTSAHCHRILEVGVGTGRVAKPLAEGGFDVVGADLSGAMLRKAWDKGLHRLVRADAAHLPFAADAFDAALMTHVLHVFEDPAAVLREASRVASRRVVIIVNQRSTLDETVLQPERQRRELFYQLRAERGYPVPPNRRRHWWRERALLRAVPPAESRVIDLPASDHVHEDWLQSMRRRAFSMTADLPDDVLQDIIAEVRRRLPDRPASRPRATTVAMWNPSQLRDLATLTA